MAPARRQHANQFVGIVVEMRIANLHRVAPRQPCERAGQIAGAWHRRTLQQHRDDARVARQRGRDLDAHEVLLVGQPPAAVGIGGAQPARADQHEQHIAGFDLLPHCLDEVGAGVDRVDVAEDLGGAEVRYQPVEQPAGVARAVFASVADENQHAVPVLRNTKNVRTAMPNASSSAT